MPQRLLIVDDEASIRDTLSVLFCDDYEVVCETSGTAALERLRHESFDLVLCDVRMPDMGGLDLLRDVRAHAGGPPVVMMTAYGTNRSGIEAMQLGAADYVTKPWDNDEIRVVVQRAIEKAALVDENVYLRRELGRKYTFANIIGRSAKMQAIFALVDRVAKTTSTVLIQGESGTGKELIARALHFASPRAENRFLSINCGALPEALLESELFGHERGAFTGAVREKKGLFQEADRGTIFLDEIGEMTPAMQVKLLRALQEKTVRKVGGNREETVDVRIIAATNQDLRERIARGAFREDLYYRINVIPVQLPPLRERREDIPLLVEFFLDKYGAQMGGTRRISVEAMRLLEGYHWPGNVRELENLVERAVALSSSDFIATDNLPLHLLTGARWGADTISLPAEGLDLEAYLEGLRAHLMAQALERTEGVQTQAAELLRMTFRSFRYYARKAGLTRGRDAGDGEGDEEPEDVPSRRERAPHD